MTEPMNDPCAERAARELYQGAAGGGPLDGREIASRFPRGVLAVDTAEQRAWVYDRNDDGTFRVRDEAGEAFDEARGWTAADGAAYDVVAVA